jgi:hypothetical protein
MRMNLLLLLSPLQKTLSHRKLLEISIGIVDSEYNKLLCKFLLHFCIPLAEKQDDTFCSPALNAFGFIPSDWLSPHDVRLDLIVAKYHISFFEGGVVNCNFVLALAMSNEGFESIPVVFRPRGMFNKDGR